MLLIITNRNDLTADFLISRLIEIGQPYFRLNSEELTEAGYLFSLNRHTMVRQYIVAGKSVDLTKVQSVWYRRMLSPGPSQVVLPAQRHFVAGEHRHLIEGLVLDPSILWVNPIEAVAIAEHKVFQLRLARELGFCIPATVISNDPATLRDFFHTHRDGVICKPIYHGLLSQGHDRYAVYTHEVDFNDLCDDLQLTSCPTLLQARIMKGTDIRVTFIGQEVFPVEIYSDNSMPLDWRPHGEQLHYRRFELLPTLEHRCRNLLERLGLSYGAFDFVKTAEGDLFFPHSPRFSGKCLRSS